MHDAANDGRGGDATTRWAPGSRAWQVPSRQTDFDHSEADAHMTHDVAIRGGTIVDGLWGEPYAAEIAVRGDAIVEIGSVSEAGHREIEAAGLPNNVLLV